MNAKPVVASPVADANPILQTKSLRAISDIMGVTEPQRIAEFPSTHCVGRSVAINRSSTRRGTVSVEFAFVAIPMFILLFAAIELGRGMMAVQALEEAARSGCRIAVLKGANEKDVKAEVNQLSDAMGISNTSIEIEPASLNTTPQWAPVTVRVTANFADMTWLPIPRHFSGLSYTAACVLPREGEIVQ
ncbi:TadE family protein [Rhodopirellula maiorica SM1]|uniref:TadE family protein n=1 Tax=Rhodopirellula maiorica SM1 TaxID=1265738 RepID=M5RSZ9_9BACT|nr:TadE/TadG family type IV pilus assembly protein [Rhodopirellula maiorica]EMI22468.1 TadE family protein [Rhodopirellula maiorica SM1]